MRRHLVILIAAIFLFQANTSSQDIDTVKYTTDFKFDDGFYLSFGMVKANNPIPLARIVTNLDRTSSQFYTDLLKQKTFVFFDANGAKTEVPVSKLWGFSRNGVLYIKKSENFHRITIIGGICHFVATITSYDSRYYDPYYGSNPYYYNSRYSYPYYNSGPRQSRNQEVKQFVLDFKSGKVLEYNVKAVEILLMEDPELHDEYMALRKKKKKQLKFFYIRKFNERNPIYLPANKKF